MATVNVDICNVCTENYNSGHRQSVSLPCGHDFCLSCLVRLRASGKHKCPTCRRNWAGLNLHTQFGMEALAAALQVDQEEEEGDVGKKKGEADHCERHSMPYDFWVNAKREFYCRKCTAEEKSYVKLELIEDAIPQVKAALAADVPEAKKKIQNNLASLDEMHANLIKKRNSVREFMKAVQAIDDTYDQKIKQVAAVRAKELDASVEMEKVEKNIKKIRSSADLDVVMECKSILKKVAASSSLPASELPQTLLSDIACCYVQEEGNASRAPSRASFVNAFLGGGVADPLPVAASSSTAATSRHYHGHEQMISASGPSETTLSSNHISRKRIPSPSQMISASGPSETTLSNYYISLKRIPSPSQMISAPGPSETTLSNYHISRKRIPSPSQEDTCGAWKEGPLTRGDRAVAQLSGDNLSSGLNCCYLGSVVNTLIP